MKKVLVAYFSASGNTAKLADRIAEATGGDLYEIKPQQPLYLGRFELERFGQSFQYRNEKPRFSPCYCKQGREHGAVRHGIRRFSDLVVRSSNHHQHILRKL